MAKKFFYVCAGLLMLASAYHLGTRNAGAASAVVIPTEVATLSGVIMDGGTIPLPIYADGTTALESECKWIVSPGRDDGDILFCFTGTGLSVGQGGTEPRYVNCFLPAGPAPYHIGREANYLIIATRGASTPTSASSQSFGALKAKYR